MKIGFVGLGKMGYQIVKKLSEAGHEMVVLDVDQAAVEKAVQSGAKAAVSRQELVTMLGVNPVVWLMIPSNFTSDEIDAFLPFLPEGALLIDGGNTNFNETMSHAEKLAAQNIDMMDVGTSGGVMGLSNGFSLMVGGSQENYERMTPAFDVLAAPKGAHAYMGNSGRGHFVKMVHNGIEYGVMQAMAEGYQLLKEGPMEGLDMEKIAEVWQHGSIVESTLNKLMVEIYQENPTLEGVEGYVADSGEGRWTLDSAHKSSIKMPVLEDALKVRFDSQNGEVSYATQILAALRNKFGGHSINKS
jgi:6-phosphogluconate dehydrogenase